MWEGGCGRVWGDGGELGRRLGAPHGARGRRDPAGQGETEGVAPAGVPPHGASGAGVDAGHGAAPHANARVDGAASDGYRNGRSPPGNPMPTLFTHDADDAVLGPGMIHLAGFAQAPARRRS